MVRELRNKLLIVHSRDLAYKNRYCDLKPEYAFSLGTS
jgi:hypothetical protein